ncbi:MAG: AGE family epimerase/isomerase [Candidatus Hodarchaeota archaeon]
MIRTLIIHPKAKKWLTYSFLSALFLAAVLPSILPFSFINIISSGKKPTNQKLFQNLNVKPINEFSTDLKLEEIIQDTDAEAYFPNFLFYSIEIANLLIENLYDTDSDCFYFSTSEEWEKTAINTDKRTYDNTQAILALVKLADAVINQTEREFALDIAEKTSNGLLTNLWDRNFGGFFASQSDRYKKPGIQAKAIQAFLALYEATGSSTYRDVAFETFNLIETWTWDETNGYYIYMTSHSGSPLRENPNSQDPYEPRSLRVDHNTLMGNALLDLYRVESNAKYLTKALQIYDIINTTCRNNFTNLFYTGVDSNLELVSPDLTDLFINSLVLEFLANLYNVTEDPKYFDDFFSVMYSVLLHFWDNTYGGFIASCSYIDSYLDDKTKFTERQFYGIRALDEAFKLTNNDLYYNLILDTVEILNTKLYDQVNGGYYQLTNADGTLSADPSWRSKFTVTQSLAIYSLANLWMYSKPGALNVLWSPSTPRPQDRVSILIAAFDSAGISNVFLNYSINNGDYNLKEMNPHSVGNMFIITLEPQNSNGTTIDFNIIISNNLNIQTIRGEYSFLWQFDKWPPEVQEIGFIPGTEIPVHEEFSIIVSAHDVPSQGDVKYVRLHYHNSQHPERKSRLFTRIDAHIWEITFPDGLPEPGTYAYYYESTDLTQLTSFSHVNFFSILGQPASPILPLSSIIGLLVVFGIIVPGGLYTYVEYKKKSARKTLKTRKQKRYKEEGRKLTKRGTKRI